MPISPKGVTMSIESDIRKEQTAKGDKIQIISPQTAFVMTKLLEQTNVPMIELNISCPNVKAGGAAWGMT